MSDLKTLLGEALEEERLSLGEGRITVDDLMAYRRGELDEAKSKLVLRGISTNPEWADRMLKLAEQE